MNLDDNIKRPNTQPKPTPPTVFYFVVTLISVMVVQEAQEEHHQHLETKTGQQSMALYLFSH